MSVFCEMNLIPVHSGLIPIHFGIIPVHSGLFRFIPVHSVPFRSIPVHSGLIPVHSGIIPVHSGIIPVHSGPFRLIPVHSGSFRSFRSVPVFSNARQENRTHVFFNNLQTCLTPWGDGLDDCHQFINNVQDLCWLVCVSE